MRHIILIFGLIALFIQSFGQETNDFFFDEFNLSVNRTNLIDYNTDDRYGFGIGAYHSFLADRKLNLVFGIEYNRTSQFKKSIYAGHFAHATDLTYTLNCLSIPLGLRFNIGNKTKIIIEAGGFADLMISSNKKGTMHTYLPDENLQVVYREFQIDKKAGLTSYIGVYFGLGVQIPISKYELIIKPDYKFGINKSSSYDNIYNRYMRLTIGFKIY